MNYFAQGNFFPPVEHKERVERYKDNTKLFRGEHKDLFTKYNFNSRRLYVTANLAGVIAKKSADFLIGDGVSVSAGKEDHAPEQEALERIGEDNDLDILFYESALENAYKGDAFFKVRYGQEFGGTLPKEIDEYRVRIESVNPEYVFPETAEHSNKLVTCYHIAIPIRIDYAVPNGRKGAYKIQVETHTAGFIEYREFEATVIRSEFDGTPYEWKVGLQIGETEVIQTGVPFPLLVHVPNFGVSDSWAGIDDMTELKPLFDELNNRLSQVASIMDKHSDPAMAIPNNLLVEDEQGRPMFRVADSKVFEVDKEDVMPQYITWNGQLTEAYTEIDRITSLILTIAEIPEVALGMGDAGTSGGSGLSIKWRMNSLLSKVKRKSKYYEKGLKRVFMIAQTLEHVVGIADYEITKPKLIFTDGLPKDEVEQTSVALQRTGGAILQSQKSAMMALFGYTEEQADAEIERITEQQDKEKDREAKVDPSIFNDDVGASLGLVDPDVEEEPVGETEE